MEDYREGAKMSHDNSAKSSNPNNDHLPVIFKGECTDASDGRATTTSSVNNHTTNSNETKDFLNSFPPGYRFKPHDHELIYHYLETKIKDPSSLPPNKINNVELYKFNPEYLAANHDPIGDNEWYFFTPRDRKYRNGQRPNRAAGDGYWKATGADKPIKRDGVVIGSKKTLVFYKGKPLKGNKTDWIMHEFGVLNPHKKKKVGEDMRLDDVVLCRIRKNAKETTKEKSFKGHARQMENTRQHNVSRPEMALQTNQAMNGRQNSIVQPPTWLPREPIVAPCRLLYHRSIEDEMLNGAWPTSCNIQEVLPENGLPFYEYIFNSPTTTNKLELNSNMVDYGEDIWKKELTLPPPLSLPSTGRHQEGYSIRQEDPNDNDDDDDGNLDHKSFYSSVDDSEDQSLMDVPDHQKNYYN